MSAIPATPGIGGVSATPAVCEAAATPAIWGTPGIAEAHVVPPFVGPSDILKISETSEVSEVFFGGGMVRY